MKKEYDNFYDFRTLYKERNFYFYIQFYLNPINYINIEIFNYFLTNKFQRYKNYHYLLPNILSPYLTH